MELDAKSCYQKNGHEASFRFIFRNTSPSDFHAFAVTNEVVIASLSTFVVHKAQTASLFIDKRARQHVLNVVNT